MVRAETVMCLRGSVVRCSRAALLLHSEGHQTPPAKRHLLWYLDLSRSALRDGGYPMVRSGCPGALVHRACLDAAAWDLCEYGANRHRQIAGRILTRTCARTCPVNASPGAAGIARAKKKLHGRVPN